MIPASSPHPGFIYSKHPLLTWYLMLQPPTAHFFGRIYLTLIFNFTISLLSGRIRPGSTLREAMTDIIIVGVIVAIALLFFVRRIVRTFTAKTPSCGCSGCGGSGCPSGGRNAPSCCSRD
ncbi:MAG: FeoB-associated Cys-rich membrane protein [Pseudodesulfovibrio sp.]